MVTDLPTASVDETAGRSPRPAWKLWSASILVLLTSCLGVLLTIKSPTGTGTRAIGLTVTILGLLALSLLLTRPRSGPEA